MPPDHDPPDTRRFPVTGVAFGGNSISGIRWLPWLVGAPLAGLTAWLLTWTAVGDLFARNVVGIAVALVVLLLPLRLRSYVRPQPPPVRVDPVGLSVYLGNRPGWRTGAYLHLPWCVITEVAVTDLHGSGAELTIPVTDDGRRRSDAAPGEAGRSLRATGTVVVSAVPGTEVDDAVRHYSRDRCRVVVRR